MSNERYIKRFSKIIVVAHWINAISFIMLVLTGLPLFLGIKAPDVLQIIHRVFAVTFLLPTPLMLVMDTKGFMQWTGSVLKWSGRDFAFLAMFPLEIIGKAKNMPKQDFFNGGQKVNSLFTILGAMTMVCSGFILWFKESFPVDVVRMAYPIHDAGMAVMVSLIFIHVYMSVGHPASRPSFIGMTKGVVPESYAKNHHGQWYDELKEKKEI